MTAVQVVPPFDLFTGADGQPLEDGFIYVGPASQNPEITPVAVYWDFDRTIPAAQPIRTINGYPSRAGTPSNIYVTDDSYSISVRDKNGVFVFSLLDSNGSGGAGTDSIVNSIAELRNVISSTVSPSLFVMGYYDSGDGGGGNYYFDATDVASPDNGGSVIVATDGARWKLNSVVGVNILQFGAQPDGTDSGPFINAMLAALGYAYIPDGTFTISTTIAMTLNGQRIIGTGRSKAILSSTTPGHSITLAANIEYATCKSFTLTRPSGSFGTTVGKDGIHCNGYAQLITIDDVEVFRHWRGLSLGPTSYSEVKNYLIDNCYDDGIHVESTSTIGAMQWTFRKGISQRNNGCGMKFQTVVGPTGASMGDMAEVSTFGNKLNGIAWVGIPSCPINAIRVQSAFVGEEGSHGIFLDTYGISTIKLANVFSEICGTLACGVDGTTPPTNVGRGFYFTPNQQEVIMTGCNAIGNSWSGLVSEAVRLTVTGGSFRLNGAALLAGERNGITAQSGTMNVNGIRANGNNGFGVFLQTDNHIVVGNDLRENVVSGLGAAVPLVISFDTSNFKV